MLDFTEDDVRRELSMADAITALRDAFRDLHAGTAQNQPRRRLALPNGAMLHSLAGACRGTFGAKIYSTHPRHGAHFFVLLFDAATARPLARFAANALGQIRTGAASGLATDLLAPAGPHTLAMIGTGFQAESQVAAMAAVRPLRGVRVWGRNEDQRRAFARRCEESLSVPTQAASSAAEALRGATLVCTATTAREPVLAAADVAPATHVNAVGSNQPTRRELPAELLDQAATIVVDSREQAELEAGDLLLARPTSQWDHWPLVEMAALTAETAPGRTGSGQLTIFKSVGLGLEDVAMAALLYERHSLR